MNIKNMNVIIGLILSIILSIAGGLILQDAKIIEGHRCGTKEGREHHYERSRSLPIYHNNNFTSFCAETAESNCSNPIISSQTVDILNENWYKNPRTSYDAYLVDEPNYLYNY